MHSLLKKSSFGLFALSCILVGIYPVVYFVIDRNFGLLSSKSQALLSDLMWNIAFNGHIIFGGIALLVGWSQFVSKWRKSRMQLHRNIGKVYMFAVLISGICSLYIAQFATGAGLNKFAFSLSGIIWLSATFLAFRVIKARDIHMHQSFMIYSYAICFSAVTLRIWLPILIILYKGQFVPAYNITAWLSWVPNLLVAYLIIQRIERKRLIKS